LSKLTLRESQVLERIVAGRLNKQMADDLGISIKTVEAHRANIMEKLNANTVADLLKIALVRTRPANPDTVPPHAGVMFSGAWKAAMTTNPSAQPIDGVALSRKLRAEVARAARPP
jgi:DNA-binding CsgD family transcriptional regulator